MIGWGYGWGMHVAIYSDVVCPWCSIGKTRFENALAALPEEDRARVIYSWMPYQLDPTAPSTATPVIDTYAKKFGGHAKAVEIIGHVTATAAAEGITFRMDRALRANTFDAHRLLWFALHTDGAAAQTALKNALLTSYFHDGENIAEHAFLVEAAMSVGLDGTASAEFLASDRGVFEVKAELAEATSMGISAVPTFVINGEWSIPGAQDTPTFVRMLTKLLAEEARA